MNSAGGPKLRAAREALPEIATGGTVAGYKLKGTRIRTGGVTSSHLCKASFSRRGPPHVRTNVSVTGADAVVTIGGDLGADWCIHAVPCTLESEQRSAYSFAAMLICSGIDPLWYAHWQQHSLTAVYVCTICSMCIHPQ